jgi:hypothetical protein
MVELFHPDNGNDCYALMARTAGLAYDAVVGTALPDTPGDFRVDIARVLALVSGHDMPIARPSPHKVANLVPFSRSFSGFRTPDGRPPTLADTQMIWGQQAIVHGTAGSGDAAGGWTQVEISPGQRYTLSCWVLLPAGTPIGHVELGLGDWPGQIRRGADPGLGDTWQRIATTATAPQVHRCHVSLLVEADPSARVISTCWQLERGEAATAYVATA